MTRIWLRDEQKVECEDISLDLVKFIRQRHAEARRRLRLIDPDFDTSRLDRL